MATDVLEERRVIGGPVVWAVAALGVIPPLIAAWVLWVAPLPDLTASRLALAGRDFTALWTAGHLALSSATAWLPDPAQFTAAIRLRFGADMPPQIWPYPPTALLLAAPLATLSLGPALCLYTAASGLVLFCALRAAGLGKGISAIVVFSPAAINCALAGQNGIIMAAALLGGLAAVDHAPARAGLRLSVAMIKPQFAVLLPLLLLAGRRWRTLAVFSLAGAAMIAGSIAGFGWGPWRDYLLEGRDAAWRYLSQPWSDQPSQRIFTSAFMTARALGATTSWALGCQATVTAVCVVLSWRAWRQPASSPGTRIALTLALTVLASPWVHGYDHVALACAIALVLSRAALRDQPWLAAGWLLPGFVVVPPAPGLQFVVSAGVARVAWRALASSRQPV